MRCRCRRVSVAAAGLPIEPWRLPPSKEGRTVGTARRAKPTESDEGLLWQRDEGKASGPRPSRTLSTAVGTTTSPPASLEL